jgi:hypothetical protein
MAKPLSIAERVIVHALLDARGPVPIATLAELTGVVSHSVRSAISAARPALAEAGAEVFCTGILADACYVLIAPDPEALRALAGPKVERPSYMGFLDRYGATLKVIVEAGGRPVPLNAITGAIYARDHGETRRRVVSMIREICARLERQGAAKTIRQVGPAAEPLYAWGSADEPQEAVVASDGVTLPSVAGVYRYAAGRLTLDGRPAGRMA